jgi:SAM-dependent methyltransferase
VTGTPTPVRQFRAFGSKGIYDEGTLRAGVYFDLLRGRGVALTCGRLLDIGSGFGGFTIHAAREGARVTAVDGDEYRLKVLRERLSKEAPDVRTRVATLKADAPRLPLADASFDHAITIGVVEWVPVVSREDGDPRAVQMDTLAEIRRILRSGGTYVLATKNRWYPPHVWRDPNSRWLLVDGLPRPAAQMLARAVWSQAYRTYNHSVRGWRAMLREAGFRSVDVLLPVSSMHWPLELLTSQSSVADLGTAWDTAAERLPGAYMQRAVGRRHGVKRLATRMAWQAGLERVLSHGFVFVATA